VDVIKSAHTPEVSQTIKHKLEPDGKVEEYKEYDMLIDEPELNDWQTRMDDSGSEPDKHLVNGEWKIDEGIRMRYMRSIQIDIRHTLRMNTNISEYQTKSIAKHDTDLHDTEYPKSDYLKGNERHPGSIEYHQYESDEGKCDVGRKDMLRNYVLTTTGRDDTPDSPLTPLSDSE
jgi:hypothetical protein